MNMMNMVYMFSMVIMSKYLKVYLMVRIPFRFYKEFSVWEL